MIARAIKVLLKFIALLAVVNCTGAADAKIVTWTIENVVFDDGGTATGFFAIDHLCPDNCDPSFWSRVVDYDIHVSGGNSGIPAFEYTPSNNPFPTPLNIPVSYIGMSGGSGSHIFPITGRIAPANVFEHRYLTLDTLEPLTGLGGTVALSGFSEFYPTRQGRNIAGQYTSQVIGEVIGIPIPEPSEILYVLPGLILSAMFSVGQMRR